MSGPFVHQIDPVIGTLFGVHLWWYGFAYTAGFLVLYLALRRNGTELGLARVQAYDLALLVSVGTLLGGRLVEVAFYEWPFYGHYPHLIPALWLGGMATHGLLLGAIAGILLFCRMHGKSFLAVTDALAIPAAFILAFGRIGNFVDGQIVGSETSVWWAVKFPDADGFRHPTVLYDGIKNLLLVPLLVYVYKRRPPEGTVTGLFLFLYAFLRIGVDVFRVYPTSLLGLATGQALNIVTSILGLALLAWSWARRGAPDDTAVAPRATPPARVENQRGRLRRDLAFAALLALPLVIPSDWTQDVPERYGKRHPGLQHSTLYPAIARWPNPPL
ncbi:MAG: prolipoprotein diacylglyceryl transferase [Betaproteobacteria bacterium]|nr:prolipoprotein diacylglyceryl transferase [Betaproteobacteria bacterium]